MVGNVNASLNLTAFFRSIISLLPSKRTYSDRPLLSVTSNLNEPLKDPEVTLGVPNVICDIVCDAPALSLLVAASTVLKSSVVGLVVSWSNIMKGPVRPSSTALIYNLLSFNCI